VRTLISTVIVFSRGNAATLTLLSEEIKFPTAKGGSQHERPSMLLRAYTLLTALLALFLPRRSLSRVGKFARGHIFPLHVRIVHYAVHLERLLIGDSPVAARSCERMSLHLPGLRHTLQALQLRSRWHLPRRKLGRRQDLGYLEGGR
jgi:hypothetical protein